LVKKPGPERIFYLRQQTAPPYGFSVSCDRENHMGDETEKRLTPKQFIDLMDEFCAIACAERRQLTKRGTYPRHREYQYSIAVSEIYEVAWLLQERVRLTSKEFISLLDKMCAAGCTKRRLSTRRNIYPPKREHVYTMSASDICQAHAILESFHTQRPPPDNLTTAEKANIEQYGTRIQGLRDRLDVLKLRARHRLH
jgi:hypothetical protein